VTYSVGFPLAGNTPATGAIKVVLLPVDFSDAVGTGQEISDAGIQIDLFNEWVRSQSRSALTVDWAFPVAWFRASRPSSDYGLDPDSVYAAMRGGDVRAYAAIVEAFGTEVVALADPVVDFTDVQFVYVLLPETIVHIDPHVGYFHLDVPSDEGPIEKLWGGGAFFYRPDAYGDDKELWSVWIHEIGHTWGLAGHAPVAILGREDEQGSTDSDLHLMGSQDALHKVFSVWDQWLLGWLPDEEVYCLPGSRLDRTDVELVALERPEEAGYRAAMIPLTESSILVVESRRSEGYGERAAPYGNGVVVYVVDTTLDYDRSGEVNGVALDRFAAYLAPPLTFSERIARGQSSRAGMDPFLMLGESVTYDGVTVSVVQSGDRDVVRIVRTAPPTTTVAPATTLEPTSTVGSTSGPQNNVVAGCGWFDSQQAAQEWLEASPGFGEGVDGNEDGVACGVGDFGGLNDCGGTSPEFVLAHLCPNARTE